ncbi:MAG: endonuclease G [Arcticibacterium sp.]|jgi:endonuclease G
MAYKNYFWQRYLGSAAAFAIVIGLIYLLNNSDRLKNLHAKLGLTETQQKTKSLSDELASLNYPETIVPMPNTFGEWVYKPNYMLYYDEVLTQARFTLHKLEGSYTRGEASRYGIRFDDEEDLASQTAKYYDYSGSGYDRGHLVPAGDFKCCQAEMTETFSMSNIAPFDSILNRYAWNELEIKTRSWARKFGTVYVITGPVFQHRFLYIGKQNEVSVPTHFFKIIFTLSANKSIPDKVIAFLLPNEPVYKFTMEKRQIKIDDIEEMTELDFFQLLPDDYEEKLESSKQTGSW